MARGYGTGGSEQQQNKHTRQHANAGSTAGPRAQDQRAAASFGVRECCEAMFVWVDIDPPSLRDISRIQNALIMNALKHMH